MAALYQRARPTTFAQVVGQEHVKDVLASAVQLDRVSHAYLFSGPRGVGKTTMARLLAMAVNCEAGPQRAPCGECESCTLVQAGSHPDVMELDAASHNSVDDVRDLQERIGLASMRGGTRVWILDEAHMLSKPAANALLKTLEEPPPGLLFVLATTEPERLPPTILSRCQHFRFRRFTDEQIVSKLERLAEGEGVAVEADALSLVARASDGGMRDAETLLERLLVPRQPVTLAAAEDALGLPPREQLNALAQALATGHLQTLMDEAARMYQQGFAPRTVAEQLARYLREALHGKLSGAPLLDLSEKDLLLALHALDDEQERFVRMNDLYSLEVALIKTSNALTGNLPVAVAPAQAQQQSPEAPQVQGSRSNSRSSDPSGHRATSAPPPFEPNPRTASAAKAAAKPPSHKSGGPSGKGASVGLAPTATRVAEGAAGAPQGRRSFSWHNVRAKAGPQLKAFLMPAAASLDGDEVTLVYQDTHSFHHSQLLLKRAEFEALLEAELGPDVRLVIEGPGGQRSAPKRSANTAPEPRVQQPAATSPAATTSDAPEVPTAPSFDETAEPARTAAPLPTETPVAKAEGGEQPGGSPSAAKSSQPTKAADAASSDPASFIPDDVALGHEELPADFWDSPTVAQQGEWPSSEEPNRTPPGTDEPRVTAHGARQVNEGLSDTGDAAGDDTAPSPLDQAFDQLQSLFPGYVVEVRPSAGTQLATDAASEALDDELDGDDGYDEDDQDRLPFGPAN